MITDVDQSNCRGSCRKSVGLGCVTALKGDAGKPRLPGRSFDSVRTPGSEWPPKGIDAVGPNLGGGSERLRQEMKRNHAIIPR